MPSLTPMRKPTLPSPVISTDAIELLSPFVPDDRQDRVLATAKSRLIKRSGSKFGRFGGTYQVFATSLPLLVGDVLAAVGSYFIGGLLVVSLLGHLFSLPSFGMTPLAGVAVAVCYSLMALAVGLYPATGSSPVWELRQQVFACCLTFLIVLTLRELHGQFKWLEVWEMTIGFAISIGAVPIMRSFVRKHFSRYRWWGEAVVVIGAGVQGQAIHQYYVNGKERGLRPLGIVDSYSSVESVSRHAVPPLRHNIPYLGSVRRLSRIGRKQSVRWGIVAPGGCDEMDMSEVMKFAGSLPHVILLPSSYLLPSLWTSPRDCAGVMGVHVKDHLRDPLSVFIKRSFNVSLSVIGLAMTLPLFLIAILWIKLKSPGPAFYGHQRIGRGGVTFKAWKFRTMVVNADQVLEEYLERDPEMRQQWIEDQKLKNDPRIIPGIGHFLRKSSLDEIPQLWNVLRGDMAVVGPRPIVKSEIVRYRNMYPLYLRVRPGLTGLWQVSGRNNTSYEQRIRLDSYYVCNWSIWLDIYIVLRTVRTILMREGAY